MRRVRFRCPILPVRSLSIPRLVVASRVLGLSFGVLGSASQLLSIWKLEFEEWRWVGARWSLSAAAVGVRTLSPHRRRRRRLHTLDRQHSLACSTALTHLCSVSHGRLALDSPSPHGAPSALSALVVPVPRSPNVNG